jgi:hypothetical protein
MNRKQRTPLLLVAATLGTALVLSGCGSDSPSHAKGDGSDHGPGSAGASAPSPTNRVDIPAQVRTNLGITFAKAEYRDVARTLRVPGSFELLPTARREYRTPIAGRVELLVTQYEHVDVGTPLYRVDSADWRDLEERIAGIGARVKSMPALREAHRVHEKSLADKVKLWEERLAQLDELRVAGGGSAAQFTDARSALNATQAELAEIMEKDADLEAQQRQAEAELRSLRARREFLIRAAGREAHSDSESGQGYLVCAVAPGRIDTLGLTQGALVEENGHVLTAVQPDRVRFRARALQSDLGRLQDGLPSRIVPPQGGSIPPQEALAASLRVAFSANAGERTIDLVAEVATAATWARDGVSAHLEITLAGGHEELAIPLSAIARDGATPILFRRDPANPDKAIRLEADLGINDGRWVVVASGLREGDEVVVGGNYQLALATSGSAPKGGHFHADGTWHEGED